ncbi:MAG: hypothetical protein KIS73_13795, partial [Enhydrobacter sp.]|nr:hypothetical protein [Enhydrobacter sp.]
MAGLRPVGDALFLAQRAAPASAFQRDGAGAAAGASTGAPGGGAAAGAGAAAPVRRSDAAAG